MPIKDIQTINRTEPLKMSTKRSSVHLVAEISLTSVEVGDALREMILKSPNLDWRDLHKGTPWHFHVGAFLEGELVSTGSFALDSKPDQSRFEDASSIWRLRAMATRQDVRGKGLGRRVVEFGLKEVAKRGGVVVWCEGRISAVRFYERCGFHSLKRIFENPGTGPHVVLVRHVV